jgi:hypothetical protein
LEATTSTQYAVAFANPDTVHVVATTAPGDAGVTSQKPSSAPSETASHTDTRYADTRCPTGAVPPPTGAVHDTRNAPACSTTEIRVGATGTAAWGSPSTRSDTGEANPDTDAATTDTQYVRPISNPDTSQRPAAGAVDDAAAVHVFTTCPPVAADHTDATYWRTANPPACAAESCSHDTRNAPGTTAPAGAVAATASTPTTCSGTPTGTPLTRADTALSPAWLVTMTDTQYVVPFVNSAIVQVRSPASAAHEPTSTPPKAALHADAV